MKLKLLLLISCLSFNLKTFAQVNFGFELNAYKSKLINISPDTIVPHGYSGAKVYQAPSYGIAPALVLRKQIRKNLSLETGLGYWSHKYKLSLRAYNRFYGAEVDSSLNISLKYIQVPILLSYEIPMKGILSLLVSGGIRTKILIYQQDNYQDIKFEDIGFSADFNAYKRIVLAPSVAFAGKWQVTNSNSLELGLFTNLDATPFARSAWGFYQNLHPARSIQTGINLRYFL